MPPPPETPNDCLHCKIGAVLDQHYGQSEGARRDPKPDICDALSHLAAVAGDLLGTAALDADREKALFEFSQFVRLRTERIVARRKPHRIDDGSAEQANGSALEREKLDRSRMLAAGMLELVSVEHADIAAAAAATALAKLISLGSANLADGLRRVDYAAGEITRIVDQHHRRHGSQAGTGSAN